MKRVSFLPSTKFGQAPILSAGASPFEARPILVKQVSDRLDRPVDRRRVAGRLFASIVALLGKDRRHAIAPRELDRGENAALVVDERVMGGWIAPRDVFELFLLMDVDQHVVVERLP